MLKQGIQGPLKLSALKSHKILSPLPPKNSEMCHETIRNSFLFKFLGGKTVKNISYGFMAHYRVFMDDGLTFK